MRLKTIRIWAYLLALSSAPSVSASDAESRALVERANDAIRQASSLVFNGSFWGEGDRKGRVIEAEGRVVLARHPEQPGTTLFRCDATVKKPGFGGVDFEEIRYDGNLHTASNPAEGGEYYEGPRNSKYNGFSSLLWSMIGFGEAEPLADLLDKELSQSPDRTIAGVECNVVIARSKDEADAGFQRWCFGKQDHLPRRIELVGADPADRVVREYSGLRVGIDPGIAIFRSRSAEPGAQPAEGEPKKPVRQPGRSPRLPSGAGLLEIGTLAPAWTLPTHDGEELSLADLKGSIVIMDFWATWCAPCRLAMPALQEIHEDWGDRGVVVVGISTGERGGDPRSLVERKGYTYEFVLHGERIAGAYKAAVLPTYYIIGPDGEIVYSQRGHKDGFEDDFEAVVQSLLPSVKKPPVSPDAGLPRRDSE